MRTLSPATLFLVAAASCASPVAAQTTAPSASPPLPSITPPATSPAPSPAPENPRALSPAVAARLSAEFPKFTPPPATAPADPRAVDRPRNTIFRLPQYVVQEEKPPAFKERHLLTPTGRLSLALQRYPGLRFGSLPFFNNHGLALAMLAEDDRLERRAEMDDLVTLLSLPSDRAKARAEVQQTFLRSDR